MEKLYEKVFLLVEKDQEINNGKMKFHSNTTSIDSSLSCITAKTNIGVLYSQSPESTASLIVDNALMEAGKGFKICPSLPNLLETAEEVG
jgi:ERCC4-type nuclease